MQTSELIEMLSKLKEQYGDVDVTIGYDDDFFMVHAVSYSEDFNIIEIEN